MEDVNAQAIRSESELSLKAHRNATESDDPLAEEPLEGGPKTSEAPPEDIPSERLLQEVDISPSLTADQRKELLELIQHHEKAFGLDGRLGNYDEKVDITLKPGVQPV